jgi:hypothetical protein
LGFPVQPIERDSPSVWHRMRKPKVTGTMMCLFGRLCMLNYPLWFSSSSYVTRTSCLRINCGTFYIRCSPRPNFWLDNWILFIFFMEAIPLCDNIEVYIYIYIYIYIFTSHNNNPQ